MKHSGFKTTVKVRTGRTFINNDIGEALLITHAVKC